MNYIGVEAAGVLAQLFPVFILVIGFESRALYTYRSGGHRWFWWIWTVSGGIGIAFSTVSEWLLIWAVIDDHSLGWLGSLIVEIDGVILLTVAVGLATISFYRNVMDQSVDT